MPVIGPHADIECELLLAGIKPAGWLTIGSREQAGDDFRLRKIVRDIPLLDQAVKEGKLISRDVSYKDVHSQEIFTIRHYAQPDKEKFLNILCRDHENLWNDKEIPEEISEEPYGTLLGYRQRDVYFFDITQRLPQSLSNWIITFNNISQIAYQRKLLTEAGHDPDKFYENLKIELV
ncbi:MAG: hypothetical protein ACT4OY_04660 [Alphaproteobacteria bacterium]